jgi:hypothetical protein
MHGNYARCHSGSSSPSPMRPRVPRMTQSALVLLSTAQRLKLGPCTPLGLGGDAQLMQWARSLQVVTC